jgi:hypothetical protein
MDSVTEIRYRYEIVQLPGGPGDKKEIAELIHDVRVTPAGAYQYTYHGESAPQVFIGSDKSECF